MPVLKNAKHEAFAQGLARRGAEQAPPKPIGSSYQPKDDLPTKLPRGGTSASKS